MRIATPYAQKDTTASRWAQARQTADSVSIRIHGSIDVLYLLKSVFDYSCQTFAANPAIASMDVSKVINVHLWPVFIAAAVTAGAFGWLAHCKLPEDKHAIKYGLIKKCHYLYPHVRNILSDIKNPRHMIVNWYFIIHGFTHVGAYGVFNPIGLALGGIVMLGMIFYRRMLSRRERYKKENFDLAKTILAENKIEHLDQLGKKIKRMKLHERVGGYAAACINGVVDGAYIMGCFFALITLGLSGLSCGAPLIAAVICVTIFTVLFAANHLCKEHEKQRQHNLSVKECDFAIEIKKAFITEELKTLKQYIDMIEKKMDFINKTNNRRLAKLLATEIKNHNKAFNNKINTHYQKALQDYINRPSYLDKIFKPFCDTQRTIISCMKNSRAAIEYILLTLGHSIKSVNAFIIALVIGVVYSAYSGIKTLYTHVTHIKEKNELAENAKKLNSNLSENKMLMLNSKQSKHPSSYSPPPNPKSYCQLSCAF